MTLRAASSSQQVRRGTHDFISSRVAPRAVCLGRDCIAILEDSLVSCINSNSHLVIWFGFPTSESAIAMPRSRIVLPFSLEMRHCLADIEVAAMVKVLV